MLKLLSAAVMVLFYLSVHAQNGYKIIRTKLPFSAIEKDYKVKQIGNKYVLNGDIIVGNAGQNLMIYQSNEHDGAYIWPKGNVPVRIDAGMRDKLTNENESMFENALTAISVLNTNTNLRIIPYTNQKDYIRIMFSPDSGYGGISPVGRKGGEQILYITRESTVKTIIHELLHSLGFWPEHSRPDRDPYVVIDTFNVEPEFRYNFQIEPGNPASAYDYNSIMHYGAFAFAMDDKKPTIRCKNGNNVYDCVFGSGTSYLSNADINGINTTYWFNKDLPRRDYVAELPIIELTLAQRTKIVRQAGSNILLKETRAIHKPLENGVYMIKIPATAKYLDIAGVDKSNGALLQQWDKVGWDNQKFAVMSLSDGLYIIKAMHSDKYINVGGQSLEFRAPIIQSDYVEQDNFKFLLQYDARQKGYTVQSLQSSMYWNVLTNDNGSKIVQEPVLKEVFLFERVGNIPMTGATEKSKNVLPKTNTYKKGN